MVKTVRFRKREAGEWEKGPDAKKKGPYKAWLCLNGTSRPELGNASARLVVKAIRTGSMMGPSQGWRFGKT